MRIFQLVVLAHLVHVDSSVDVELTCVPTLLLIYQTVRNAPACLPGKTSTRGGSCGPVVVWSYLPVELYHHDQKLTLIYPGTMNSLTNSATSRSGLAIVSFSNLEFLPHMSM